MALRGLLTHGVGEKLNLIAAITPGIEGIAATDTQVILSVQGAFEESELGNEFKFTSIFY